MWQFSRVSPSEYQPRYSPFTRQLRTVTFLACQKASLVFSSQFSTVRSSVYWKEYLPLSFRPLILPRRLPNRKYSEVISQPSSTKSSHRQPNSGDTTRQPRKVTSRHSRKHLTPSISQSRSSPSSAYQRGARVRVSNRQSRIKNLLVCQKGYRREKLHPLTVTSRASLKADSPSAGPAKVQSVTSASQR